MGFVLGVILSPIYTAIGLFLTAGMYHLLVLSLVQPANAGFKATFRVVSYAPAIQLLGWIPIANLVALFYSL